MAVSIFMSVSKKEVPWCPIDATLAVIDGRWKGTIVWCLLAKPMRPCELQRVIPQITERMLLRHICDLVTTASCSASMRARSRPGSNTLFLLTVAHCSRFSKAWLSGDWDTYTPVSNAVPKIFRSSEYSVPTVRLLGKFPPAGEGPTMVFACCDDPVFR